MIPTYNSAGYLRQTLASVLAQDPGPDVMQIEVLDDCSDADDPEAVVKELGLGRVEFYRQPHNVGSTANINACIQRSRGQLVHILHSDDLILPGYYHTLGTLMEQHSEAGAGFCRFGYVDEQGSAVGEQTAEQEYAGELPNWLERIAARQRIQYAAIVVRREVYEKLGGFDTTLTSFAEDWEMWARIAAHYAVAYDPQLLAYYRVHKNSVTSSRVRSGANMVDMRRCIAYVSSYLPPFKAGAVSRDALQHYTLWAYHSARKLLGRGDGEAAWNQWREAIKTSRSPKTIAWALIMLADLLHFRLTSPGQRTKTTPFADSAGKAGKWLRKLRSGH